MSHFRVQALINVEANGRFSGQLPRPVTPGVHRAVLEIDETATTSRPPLRLPVLAFEVPPEEQLFERETLYGNAD